MHTTLRRWSVAVCFGPGEVEDMSMSAKGFWLFTLLVSFLVTGAATAYACHEPALGSFPGGYRAGETVTFSVSGAQADATYSLQVEGHNVAEGTVTGDGGFSSTFIMPDLGSSGSYYAYLEITHEGHSGSGSWPSSQPIRFEAPTAASGESSSDAQQQEQQGQQGQKRSQEDGSEQRPQTDGSPVGGRDEATQQPTASSPALSQAQQAQGARSANTAQRSNTAARGAIGTDVADATRMKRPATTPLTQPMAAVATDVSHLTEVDGRGPAEEWFDGLMDGTFASSAGDAEATERRGIDVFPLAAAAVALTLLLLLGARRPRSPARVIAFPRPRKDDLFEDRAA